jgi:membrane protease YdiL (CAAX protease family)
VSTAEHIVELPLRIPERERVGRVRTWTRRRPLVAFFVLAYAFSWSLSAVYLFTHSGPAILSCGPFLAAAVVLALSGGRPGIKSLFASMLKWRVGYRWWLIAVGVPVLVTAAATGLNLALGADTPTAHDFGRWTNVLPTALVILLFPGIGGAWEEPGWRGYALPRLLERRGAVVSTLVLGVLWSGWHIPVFLVGDQHWSDLLLVVEVTVVLTWLFQNTFGSVLIAMVFHALNNAVSGEYFSQMFDGSDSTRQSWMLCVVWGVFATALIVSSRRPGHVRR